MGPHFFKCGKSKSSESKVFARRRFNGAALFQVRKGVIPFFVHFMTVFASMGPHFFKCGKHSRNRAAQRLFTCFNGAALFQVRKDNINIVT